MKKVITLGIMALAVAVASQQKASAWVNLKAGVGANMCWQSGGNCLFWGLFRNGQPPGPGGDCGAFPGMPYGPGAPGYGPGGPGPVGYPGPGPVPPGYGARGPMDHGAVGHPAAPIAPPGVIPGRTQSYIPQNVGYRPTYLYGR